MLADQIRQRIEGEGELERLLVGDVLADPLLAGEVAVAYAAL